MNLEDVDQMIQDAEKKVKDIRDDFKRDTPTLISRIKAWFSSVTNVLLLITIVGVGSLVFKDFKSTAPVVVPVETAADVINKGATHEEVVVAIKKEVEVKAVEVIKEEPKVVPVAPKKKLNTDVMEIDLNNLKFQDIRQTYYKDRQSGKTIDLVGARWSLERFMPNHKGTSVYLTVFEEKGKEVYTKKYLDKLPKEEKKD